MIFYKFGSKLLIKQIKYIKTILTLMVEDRKVVIYQSRIAQPEIFLAGYPIHA